MRRMERPVEYRELVLRAAEERATRLSWDASGRKVAKILDEAVGRNPPPASLAYSIAG